MNLFGELNVSWLFWTNEHINHLQIFVFRRKRCLHKPVSSPSNSHGPMRGISFNNKTLPFAFDYVSNNKTLLFTVDSLNLLDSSHVAHVITSLTNQLLCNFHLRLKSLVIAWKSSKRLAACDPHTNCCRNAFIGHACNICHPPAFIHNNIGHKTAFNVNLFQASSRAPSQTLS